MVLGSFAVSERAAATRRTAAGGAVRRATPGFILIGGFTVRVHDAPSGGNPIIQHTLHDSALVSAFGQTNGVTLPIGAGPGGFLRESQAGDGGEKFTVAVSEGAAEADQVV
jgi:hypothetical protein